MRVVIRGDRSTGKSCLFNRLQGKPFIEEYNQTPAIQISSIHWNYKGNLFISDQENLLESLYSLKMIDLIILLSYNN